MTGYIGARRNDNGRVAEESPGCVRVDLGQPANGPVILNRRGFVKIIRHAEGEPRRGGRRSHWQGRRRQFKIKAGFFRFRYSPQRGVALFNGWGARRNYSVNADPVSICVGRMPIFPLLLDELVETDVPVRIYVEMGTPFNDRHSMRSDEDPMTVFVYLDL